jgi:tRNA-dihydrouridine synthase B
MNLTRSNALHSTQEPTFPATREIFERVLRIGPYELTSPFLLAPMAGITDAPFRRLCRRFGAGMTTCADPLMLATAATLCVERGAQIIDINMGCPARKVCNKLAGSALLQDTKLVSRILESVVGSVAVPVTLKMRTGWDEHHRNGVEIAQIAEASGVHAIAVHGRTRACRFKGAAEYETIAQIKNKISIPVIANGDITTPEKSLEVLRLSSADGLMIGRGAQGRPWIFHELNHFFETGRQAPPLAKNDVRDIMLGHLNDLYQFYGKTTGVRVARKHLTWYCAGLENSQDFRSQVVRVDSASEQVRLTREFFDQPAFFGRPVEGNSLAA